MMLQALLIPNLHSKSLISQNKLNIETINKVRSFLYKLPFYLTQISICPLVLNINMRQKTIEETYQKKTPLEHILLRPDTYVGSIQMEKSAKWILREGLLKFTNQEVTYVPALYKIFDQVLVNAADNYQRDKKMNMLKVQINKSEGFVRVFNNGKGIPVQMHKTEKIYVPQLIFGHLLTGSNYNDDEKKVVGGRNGYGAKLANIFSHTFIVECGDGAAKKKFKMVWKKNMTTHGQPEVQNYSGKDYTIVTFYPEFRRFQMERFDDDIVALMRKRVYDMAGLLPNVKVFLDGNQLEVNSFLKYVDMYFNNTEECIKIRDQGTDNQRWQIVVSVSDGEFRQVSFVNGICTSKGGTHVNYITDQIVEKIQQKLSKKDKNINVKPFQIKGHLWIFVNALIQNPAFDSQTKETLTLKASQFGSKCQLTEKLIKDVLKTGIVDDIYNEARQKQLTKLAKMTGGQKKAKLTGIPKLEDANEAGTRNSDKCTLILTQGDSAKSLAVAGLEVVGRDYYGVFPLKGKLLNVREASNTVLMKNQQIQSLLKIVGLQVGKKYDDLKSLRYGSIMIMSDQDTDGSHIKGLVVNFIHFFWPSLFQMRGFLKQFITPLLKVSKNRQVISFYTMRDFKRWAQNVIDLNTWKIKYYKGLGTSTDKEAQEYFQQLQRNRIYFIYESNEDDECIQLVFSRKNIEKRKDWLSTYDPDVVMPYDRNTVRYKEFIDKQFIHFSNEDNHRSIASIIDGFKPGQRKIIYACFKRNLKDQIKVAQLAGYVAQHSAYHHGQMSLTGTIVNMAQNYVGSNNINLLMPNGQFGSRNQGGKDHASARYIFTNLNRITRVIFPQADDHTLTYVEDDGQLVQPQFYVPILPMILVNGCDGIGSGWSTNVPNFNPRQIANQLLRKLESDDDFTELFPWFRGYSGEITLKSDGNYEVKGILQFDETNPGIVHIKELPIGKWTKDYKEYLDDIMNEGDTKIVGLKEYHTKNTVHFEIEMNEEYYNQNRQNMQIYEKLFKLTSSISMKNLVGFNQNKKLARYPSIKSILQQFYEVRLVYYDKRKEYLMSKLVRELQILSNKERFILQVVEEKIIIRNIKKIKIVQLLKQKGYKKFSDFPTIKSTKGHAGNKKEGEQEDKEEQKQGKQTKNETVDESKEYNYLLTMPLWNLSFEKVQEIKQQRYQKAQQLSILEETSTKQMWKTDLQEFLVALQKFQAAQEQEKQTNVVKGRKNDKAQKAKKKYEKKAKEEVKPGKKGINWDSESQCTQDKVKGKGKNEPKVKKNVSKKKEGSKKKQTDEKDDIISRVKKQLEQKKNEQFGGLGVIAKPDNSKIKTIDQFFKPQKQGSEANLQLVSKPNTASKNQSSKRKKKKMSYESDQTQSEVQSWKQSEDDQ